MFSELKMRCLVFLKVQKVNTFWFTIEQGYFRFLLQMHTCERQYLFLVSLKLCIEGFLTCSLDLKCAVDSQGNIN